MSTECRVTLAWQVATVAKHLVLRDRQVYLSKDGRATLISAGPVEGPLWSDDGGGYAGLADEAAKEKANAEVRCSCPGWGVAMQALNLVAGAYVVVGAAMALAATMATNPVTQQTQQQIAALAASIGVSLAFVGQFVDWIANTISTGTEHASGGGAAGDSCGCVGDK